VAAPMERGRMREESGLRCVGCERLLPEIAFPVIHCWPGYSRRGYLCMGCLDVSQYEGGPRDRQ
jgi:hypothetical protein